MEAATPQATGVTINSYWNAEVTDLAALVAAVAKGAAPIEALQADIVYLNKLARLHQDTAKALPGTRFIETRKTGRTSGGGPTNGQ
jgi:hypothetical protein